MYEVLDHGELELLDFMGSDETIEMAARISYSAGRARKVSDREKLLRHLMRHRHTSPFEMAELMFRVKCPIFVARQWMRHRTGSFNEISARYSELPEEFHMPEEWRGQSKSNKQGSEGSISYDPRNTPAKDGGEYVLSEEESFDEYGRRLEAGIAREQARGCLPMSTYTEFVWKTNLHNLLHFLSLRMDPHAQEEIRVYAEIIGNEIVKSLFPITWQAFLDYRMNSVTFTAAEMPLLFSSLTNKAVVVEGLTDRETREYQSKMDKVLHWNVREDDGS